MVLTLLQRFQLRLTRASEREGSWNLDRLENSMGVYGATECSKGEPGGARGSQGGLSMAAACPPGEPGCAGVAGNYVAVCGG